VKKLLFGIIVSAAFVYFSLRGLEYERIIEGLEGVRYFYLLPVTLLYLIVSLLRSLRWGIIVSPLQKIGQKELYPISCIGYMSSVLVPMRMGEFVKPYLLSAKNLVPFGSALATVFVERVLDVMAVLGIFLLITLNASLPPWLEKSGHTALAVFALLVVFMCVLYFRTQMVLAALSPAFKVLPRRFHDRVEDLIHRFVEGFRIIASPGRLMGTLLLSVLIWGLSGFAIFVLFSFHNFQLSLLVAFVVLVVNIIGISLPTAPGMLGNFQFACILALSWFDVPKDAAFLFSMVSYFMGVGMVILLGLVFLPSIDVSLKDAMKNIKRALGSP
jgi:uncharacterized protein (TIRG00374 family)